MTRNNNKYAHLSEDKDQLYREHVETLCAAIGRLTLAISEQATAIKAELRDIDGRLVDISDGIDAVSEVLTRLPKR